MNITNVLRLRSSIRSIGKIDPRFLSSIDSVACEDSEENETNEIKKGTNTSFTADAECFQENETGEIQEGIKSSFTAELLQRMRLKNSERESNAPSLQNCAFARTFLPCILPHPFAQSTRAFAYKSPPTFKCLVCFSERLYFVERSSEKIRLHYLQKYSTETRNHPGPFHYIDAFCPDCGNGFESDDAMEEHQLNECEHN